MKKALAVLWSPKSLLDFLWYYEAYGKKKYQYDVLVLTAGADADGKWKTRIRDYVENAGIFGEISTYQGAYINQGFIKKLITILKMGWYALKKKQKEYCVKEMKKWLDVRQYEQIVTVFLPTVFSGELLVLSEDIEVVLLEDGQKDYVSHRKWPTWATIKQQGIQFELAGCILSKMGYADPTTSYKFEPTKRCIKFSTAPDKLQYRDYKSIHKLNDMSLVDEAQYQSLVEKTFQISLEECKADIILFTTPLYDFEKEMEEELVKKTVDFIEERYHPNSVIIKKHPRDYCEYLFPNETKTVVIDANIPAELLIDLVDVKTSIFMYPTASLSSWNSFENCVILKYEKLVHKSAYYRWAWESTCKNMEIPDRCVVTCVE